MTPPDRLNHKRLLLALLSSFVMTELALGCGGAPTANMPRDYAGMPIETAKADLDKYENDMLLALGTPKDAAFAAPPMHQSRPVTETKPTEDSARTTAAQQPSPPPMPTTTAAPTATVARSEDERVQAQAGAAAEEAAPVSNDPCAIACRALASMGRAASHICDIAGENDERCENARGRVKNAEERVRSACPACN